MSAEQGEQSDLSAVVSGNEVVTRYVLAKMEGARKAAEGCGCSSCRKYYQSWVNWVNEVVESGTSLPLPFPTPPSPDELPPDHPKFGPDDPPPGLDSGNLADWYAAGI